MRQYRYGRLEALEAIDTRDPREVRRALFDLVDANRELERVLEDWYKSLQFGPVRGAYAPLTFRSDDSPLIGTSGDFGSIPVACRPIAFECSSQGTGSFTFTLYDGAGTQVLSQQALVPHTIFRLRSDFDVDRIEPGRSSLTVDSIDSGTPERLRATLWVVGMDKLEDV